MAQGGKSEFPISKKGALPLLAALAIAALALFLSTKLGPLSELGYAGVFLISLISSATIFIPVPGFAAVLATASVLDPVLLGIAAGAGSAIGELSGYLAGIAGHGAVERTPAFKSHKGQVSKYGPAAIFLLAFIPNPVFDVAGIAAGAIRMEWWKFLLATSAGKILRFILLAYFGIWAADYFF